MRGFHEKPVGVESYELVTGDRQGTYGDPLESLTRIGRLWGAALGIGDIPPRTVSHMMILLKVSRDLPPGKPHRDNEVDICGYAHLLQFEREEGTQPMAMTAEELTNLGDTNR
jgi:hypothetical protein